MPDPARAKFANCSPQADGVLDVAQAVTIDGDHVDAPIALVMGVLHIGGRQPGQVALLARAHRLLRKTVVCRLQRAHFDEYQLFARGGDDVQLTRGVTPVLLDDLVALPPEVLSRPSLATLTKLAARVHGGNLPWRGHEIAARGHRPEGPGAGHHVRSAE